MQVVHPHHQFFSVIQCSKRNSERRNITGKWIITETINLRTVQSATEGVDFAGQIYSSCMKKKQDKKQDETKPEKMRQPNTEQDAALHRPGKKKNTHFKT